MSCNGCRVLRKGCSESCILRPCLQWIESPESQGHATVFVAKFFGRAGLMSFISAVPESQRPGMYIFLHMYNVIRALFLFYFILSGFQVNIPFPCSCFCYCSVVSVFVVRSLWPNCESCKWSCRSFVDGELACLPGCRGNCPPRRHVASGAGASQQLRRIANTNFRRVIGS